MKLPSRRDVAVNALAISSIVCAGLTAVWSQTKALSETRGDLATAAGIACVFFLVSAVGVAEDKTKARLARSTAAAAVLAFIGLAVMYPVFLGARSAPPKYVCLSNVRQIGVAFALYQADTDDRLPPARNWYSTCVPYLRSHVKCPEARGAWSYAMNAEFGGARTTTVEEPGSTVLEFEADAATSDASGGRHLLVRRHSKSSAMGFVDGSARLIDSKEEGRIRWTR